MIAILEPLARFPGVELVLLLSHDGVPIASAPAESHSAPAGGRGEVLAALAASWLNELTQAVAPLSWNPPERVLLRAARGTLVLRRSESACLLVLLSRETAPEDVRLSMDGTLARIERARLVRSREGAETGTPPTRGDDPRGPIPSGNDPPGAEEGVRPSLERGPAPGSS